MKKKLCSILLALTMVLTLLPVSALADVGAPAEAPAGESTPTEAPAASNVAKIGDKEYATLAKAVEAAESGATITLLSDVTASTNASYYKMTIKPDTTYVVSKSGDKVDLSNGMSVTARVEYDQITYFEYAMEALGVLFH